jgi:hypothetical protein
VISSQPAGTNSSKIAVFLRPAIAGAQEDAVSFRGVWRVLPQGRSTTAGRRNYARLLGENPFAPACEVLERLGAH